MRSFTEWFAGPAAQVALAVLLTVVGARLTAQKTNCLLILAFAIAVHGVFRFLPDNLQPLAKFWWTLLAACFIGGVLWLWFWSPFVEMSPRRVELSGGEWKGTSSLSVTNVSGIRLFDVWFRLSILSPQIDSTKIHVDSTDESPHAPVGRFDDMAAQSDVVILDGVCNGVETVLVRVWAMQPGDVRHFQVTNNGNGAVLLTPSYIKSARSERGEVSSKGDEAEVAVYTPISCHLKGMRIKTTKR